MRIKIALISICILAFSFTANAQLKFGVRGGVNFSNVVIDDFPPSNYELAYNTGAMGYHFGVIGQVKFLGIFVQPELLLTTAKTDIQLTPIDLNNFTRGEPLKDEQRFTKFDMPIIAGVKLGPLKLQAGPVGTFMINSKSDLLEQEDLKQNFKGMTFGYQAGVGLELANLLVDLKYEGNLSKLGDAVMVGDTRYDFDQRMSQWVLSIGFLFGN